MKLSWDDELNSEHKRIWNKWLLDLQFTNSIAVPRYLFADTKKIVDCCEIHGSIVFSTEDGLSSTLITGKSRICKITKPMILKIQDKRLL